MSRLILDFLSAEFQRRKKINASYTLRAFARDLGMESATLSQIMKGKRKITFETAKDICDAFKLPLDQRNTFLLSLDDSSQFVDSDFPQRTLTDQELLRLARWEAYAVLSALDIKSIEPTVSGVAAKVGCGVDIAAEMLETFEELGVVKKDSKGKYAVTSVSLTAAPTPTEALIQSHSEWLHKALDALKNHRKESDFSGITMAISMKKLPEARRRITDFRRSLAKYLGEGGEDEVYRLNIQIFPVK